MIKKDDPKKVRDAKIRYLHNAGFSQSEIADRAKCSQGTVSRVLKWQRLDKEVEEAKKKSRRKNSWIATYPDLQSLSKLIDVNVPTEMMGKLISSITVTVYY